MRPLALILAALLALAVGWALLGSEPASVELEAPTRGAAPAGEPMDEASTEVSALEAASVVVAEPAEVERRSLAERGGEGEAAQEPTARLTVRVSLEDGTFIPDAEVFLLERGAYDRSAYRERERALVVEAGRPELLRAFGLAATTDGAGLAQFAWGGERADAWVVCPFGVKRSTIRPEKLVDGVHDLVLPEPGFALRVLGPGGRPMEGVRVHAERSMGIVGIPVGGTGFVEPFDQAKAVTGPDGIAYPLDRMSLARFEFSADAFYWSLVVHALVTGGSKTDPDRTPDRFDPFEFQLPPTGPLEVRLVDSSGELVRDEQFTVAALFADAEFGDGSHPFIAGSSVEGRVRFDHVELGRELRIGAASVDREFTVERLAPAVTSASEPLVVELPVAHQRQIVLEAVDAEGKALRREPIVVRLLDADGATLQANELRCARDGTVEVLLDELPDERPGQGEPLIMPAELVATAELDDQAVEGRMPLPAVTGRVQLGRLVFEPLPLVASGRVVDHNGEPVRNAIVTVQDRTSPRSTPRGHLGFVDIPTDTSSLPSDAWRPRVPEASARTDRDGRFVLRAADVIGPIALDPGFRRGSPREGVNHSAGAVPVAVGQEDVLLTIVPAGAVVVRVRHAEVDDFAPLLGMTLHERVAGHVHALRLRGEQFEYDRLPPVACDLVVTANGFGQEVARVENVVVPSGTASSDPRLDPLDLTDALRVTRLTVLDPDGEEFERWTLFTDRAGMPIPRTESGQVLVPAGVPLHAHLSAGGHPTVEIETTETDVTVQLERGIEMTLALDGLDATLDPAQVFGTLRPADADQPRDPERGLRDSFWVQFDSAGRAATAFPEPGTYSVSLMASGGRQRRGGDITIEVAAGDAGRTLSIQVPADLRAR